MYALKCSCGESIAVTAGQAGDEVTCPKCGEKVSIPLLRELRQSPRVEADDQAEPASGSLPLRVGFGAAGMVALVAAAFATFALVSAMVIEVDFDTQQHLDYERQMMQQSPPASLIPQWEALTETSLQDRRPYPYQQAQDEKTAWQRRAIGGYSLAAVAVLAAIGLGVADRRSSRNRTLGR